MKSTLTRQEAEQLLKQNFNLSTFYDSQWETIHKILQGERVLLIEKTGFGKSLCFQFPATVFDGVTVVFSPLIALMRDQVKKLNSLGIGAECINSGQTDEENARVIADAKDGKIKILYIAPERQENSEWVDAVKEIKLSMVVVDEAHCISVWGHDFRPAFRRIVQLVNLLPKGLPVLATTATATKRVEQDIAKQMGENLTVIRGNLLRDNFKLFVIPVASEDEKLIWLGKNVDKLPGTGIIYTGTRVDTEIYSNWFAHLNISSAGYNGGLDSDSRVEIEDGLMNNRWKCVVSTNALGMGIDKPDIRFIIHTQIPQSPVHYYQEIGRAGRDGKTAYIILFFNPEDRTLPEAFIENGKPSIKKYRQVIDVIQSDFLGLKEIVRHTNLKQNQVQTIKADLIEQGIIREVVFGKTKKYEYVTNAPALNVEPFEKLRLSKLKDLENMIAYVETTGSRMKFLCDYLGDNALHNFSNCDNTGEKRIKVIVTPEWTAKLQDFQENYFPELNVESRGSNIINGIASSYYGISNVGASIHRCKYEQGGDFPDFLLKLTLRAFQKKLGNEKFDLLLYVPPTCSGDLVRNFAEKLAHGLNIPISHNLHKKRTTKEQKVFENSYLKADNVHDAFTIENSAEVKGKQILVFDDIYDSGATIKEIGKYLTSLGAEKIAPLVIAKTVGGDIVC